MAEGTEPRPAIGILDTRFPVDNVSDANNLPKGFPVIVCTGASTLNTPYKAGMTGGNVASYILSMVNTGNYGFQICFPLGMQSIFTRIVANNVWGNWINILA